MYSQACLYSHLKLHSQLKILPSGFTCNFIQISSYLTETVNGPSYQFTSILEVFFFLPIKLSNY
jgi:hypothetical protein